MRRIIHLLSAAALWWSGGLMLAGASKAQIEPESWEAANAGRLIIEFEGGVVSTEMKTVLMKLAAAPGIVPSRPFVLKPEHFDDCVLLKEALQGRDEYCAPEIVAALKAFSMSNTVATGPRGRYRPGDTLYVPDIQVEYYTFRRSFDTSKEKQRKEFDIIRNNPEWLKLLRLNSALPNAGTAQPPPTGPAPTIGESPITSLAFAGIRWTALLKEKAAVLDADVLALDLAQPNVAVYVERTGTEQAAPRKYAELTPSAYYDRCISETLVSTDKGAYNNYFATDYDPSTAVKCETGNVARPTVYIMDSGVAPNPDIPVENPSTQPPSKAAGVETEPKRCVSGSDWNPDAHHGTYLAGIVASSGTSTGLVGMNPEVRIWHIPWIKGVRDNALKQEITRVYADNQPQIFLFASNFQGLEATTGNDKARSRIWARRADGESYSNSEFKNPEVRLKHIPVNRTVSLQIKPLLIVAAGQNKSDEDDETGDELRLTSAASPQNIGNLANVIVVTACQDCGSGNASLWEKANHGLPSAGLVQLAAPGGEPIAGLMDGYSLGQPKFGGTSAAAAFTAGVAAKMMACYPSYYLRAKENVKEQLLLTGRANLKDEDRSKLPAGTLDPSLALIDPNKSWLKLEGQGGLIDVKNFGHWCDDTLALSEGPADDEQETWVYPSLRQTRRITDVGNGTFLVRELSLSLDSATVVSFSSKGPGKPTSLAKKIAAVEIEGRGQCAIQLSGLKDLILKKDLPGRKKVAACESLKPCFP
ncbi:MAG: S8 family serine peptidase [Hyphomicrobium sp.]